MRIRTITVFFIMALLLPQFMLSACKKTDTAGKTAQQSSEMSQKDKLIKSFEESKKITAAKVNGEAITMFDLLRQMNALAPQYVKPGQQLTPELNGKIKIEALNVLIFKEMAVQAAKKSGMKIDAEMVDEELKKIKTKSGSDKAFQDFLDYSGFTVEALRKTLERDLLFQMVVAHKIYANIPITDADLRARYKRDKAGLKDAANRQMTFEAAKGLLEQRIQTEVGEKKIQEWEKELKKNARIEIIEQKQKQG